MRCAGGASRRNPGEAATVASLVRAFLAAGELSAAQRALLGEEYGRPLVPPPTPFAPITALRARDWAAVESEYSSKRVVVIDGLLDALTEQKDIEVATTEATQVVLGRCDGIDRVPDLGNLVLSRPGR